MGYYDGLGAFVGFMLVIVIISALVALAVVVVNIVFFCIGLKKMHYDKWWLAIIPFCTPYAVIDCTGEPEVHAPLGICCLTFFAGFHDGDSFHRWHCGTRIACVPGACAWLGV